MKDCTDRPKPTTAKAEREKRLAAALRANLKRRKAAGKAAGKSGPGSRENAPKQT